MPPPGHPSPPDLHRPTPSPLTPALTSRRRQRRSRRPADVFSQWCAPPPTCGELERLFFAALAKALPLHFSTAPLVPARRNGRTRITNAHVLVRSCRPGSSYCALFGTWSEVQGYSSGPIVQTLDRRVPFLKARSVSDMAQAREYLSDAVLVRREELQTESRSYQQHIYMVRVMDGTLQYLDRLLEWLGKEDAPAWIPIGPLHIGSTDYGSLGIDSARLD